MTTKFAFAGLRHAHIFCLYNDAKNHPDIEVVAACEEDAATYDDLKGDGKIDLTHTCIDTMLDEVDCDVVAVGDYYAKRGSIILNALHRHRHVIADKPICTSLTELHEIETLALANDLRVGCMLDMRDVGAFIGLRDIVRGGRIGEVHAITFGGQHPLMVGVRPGWYFEEGKHGGTINDIAIHAVDAIRWITGLEFKSVNAARCWNAFAGDSPHFLDGAQMMLTMNNGCGVTGDVSYFAPDSMGYKIPQYWRTTFWGREGVAEASSTSPHITLALNGEAEPQVVAPPAGQPGGYLQAFMADVAGSPEEDGPTTRSVLDVSRITLTVQRAADEDLRDVALA